jgi:ferredoxin
MAMVQIDPGRCNGCGICVKSCPADVIQMDRDNKKAVIRYAQDCFVECPEDAVFVSTEVKTTPLFTSWG